MNARTAYSTLNVPVCVRWPDGLAERAALDLEWSVIDPVTVRATFRAPGYPPVTWLIARDLFMDGVGAESPAGAGQVEVCAENARLTRLGLVLVEDGSTADVLIPTHMLVRFLDSCEDACPCGSDAEQERLDAQVEACLLVAFGGDS